MGLDSFLDSPALDGSHGQAFASHKARANGIAKYFACTRHLSDVNGQAGEDSTTTLLAHFHAVSVDPGFQVEGREASKTAAPVALRRLDRGNGLVGTHGASTKRDYDMALKGLVVLAFRYPHLLGVIENKSGVDFILNDLFPPDYGGGHDPDIEIVEQSFLNLDTPETENHLLMIESSRYLFNQLRHMRPGDEFDNETNGLRDWLLNYMQRVAKHDFLEFNSRPYQRLALHPLLNLHEFALHDEIKTAAQILLDYTMVKFAVSSIRGHRVSPFRRQQHRVNHQANEHNNLYAAQGDPVVGYFMSYTGFIDWAGNPGRFLPSLDYNALIAGTSAYRPPPAAYILAMDHDHLPYLHRFYHGIRPQLPAAGEDAESGLEIYYRSRSFLLSAGGSFLNSGYGQDERDIGSKNAWEQTSRAQATTLIPKRIDIGFHDLIRFEPYPDPMVDPYADDREDPDNWHTRSVNIGVSRGLAAGANLRPAEKKTILENSTSASPVLTAHNGRPLIAWKGSGNDHLNVARVQDTTKLGIDGVEGVEQTITLGEFSDRAPALASHNGRLFLAWKGSGNPQLNLAYSDADGFKFLGKITLADSSEHSPSLVSHGGRLFLAWTGRGNGKLNVAKVILIGNTAGGFGIEGLEGKVVLGDSTESTPALASHNGRLFLGWKGRGNDNLNLVFSEDNGASFRGKTTLPETSSHGPSLASHAGRLFVAWKGSGNKNLNVAKVVLFGNTAGGFGIEGLEAKVVLGETSTEPPALGSHNGLLFIGWKGEGGDHLNLRVSRDGAFQTSGPWIFSNLGHLGFFVAIYRTPPSQQPGFSDAFLDNLALVYAMEAYPVDEGGMDFRTFEDLTRDRNRHLPARLDYGGTYEFHAPDEKRFSIWFDLTEEKYRARVVEEGESLPIFTSLPLVSGKYLNAPGGHDGLIEIRHPGCTQPPIVLDYRVALKPRRDDNKSSCSQPWLERAQALFAIAQKFGEQPTRAIDAQAALVDAVKLYDDLLKLSSEQNGPLLAPAIIQALGRMGVDYSVPQAELSEWLANPLYTPYPAISQALLLLGRRLKAPVFLDVIVWNYEHAPGVASPRNVADVKPEVLKAAILEGSNVRYGTQLTDFEKLLLP